MKKDIKPIFLLQCGSCKYKKNGKCKNIMSDCHGEIVDNECSCEYWKPKRGLKIYG